MTCPAPYRYEKAVTLVSAPLDRKASKNGYLYQAAVSVQTLREYARAQQLSLAELLAWERRLIDLGVAPPERHRPARFVGVEVVA